MKSRASIRGWRVVPALAAIAMVGVAVPLAPGAAYAASNDPQAGDIIAVNDATSLLGVAVTLDLKVSTLGPRELRLVLSDASGHQVTAETPVNQGTDQTVDFVGVSILALTGSTLFVHTDLYVAPGQIVALNNFHCPSTSKDLADCDDEDWDAASPGASAAVARQPSSPPATWNMFGTYDSPSSEVFNLYASQSTTTWFAQEALAPSTQLDQANSVTLQQQAVSPVNCNTLNSTAGRVATCGVYFEAGQNLNIYSFPR